MNIFTKQHNFNQKIKAQDLATNPKKRLYTFSIVEQVQKNCISWLKLNYVNSYFTRIMQNNCYQFAHQNIFTDFGRTYAVIVSTNFQMFENRFMRFILSLIGFKKIQKKGTPTHARTRIQREGERSSYDQASYIMDKVTVH